MPNKKSRPAGSRPTTDSCLCEIESFALKHRLKTKLSEDGTRIIQGKFGHIYEYDIGAFGVQAQERGFVRGFKASFGLGASLLGTPNPYPIHIWGITLRQALNWPSRC